MILSSILIGIGIVIPHLRSVSIVYLTLALDDDSQLGDRLVGVRILLLGIWFLLSRAARGIRSRSRSTIHTLHLIE